MECRQIIRTRFRVEEGFILWFARCVQIKPIFDITQDHAFWPVMRLGQPEPMIIAKAESHVGAFEMFKCWDDIQHTKSFHGFRRIQCQPMRNPCATIMRQDLKAWETEACHQRHHIGGHCALGIRRMIRADRRLGRIAIAAQIRRDHSEITCQNGGHTMPHGMGLRIAVQQQERRPGTGTAQPDALPIGFACFQREAFKEGHDQPPRRAAPGRPASKPRKPASSRAAPPSFAKSRGLR